MLLLERRYTFKKRWAVCQISECELTAWISSRKLLEVCLAVHGRVGAKFKHLQAFLLESQHFEGRTQHLLFCEEEMTSRRVWRGATGWSDKAVARQGMKHISPFSTVSVFPPTPYLPAAAQKISQLAASCAQESESGNDILGLCWTTAIPGGQGRGGDRLGHAGSVCYGAQQRKTDYFSHKQFCHLTSLNKCCHKL